MTSITQSKQVTKPNSDDLQRSVVSRLSLFLMIIMIGLAGYTFQLNMFNFPHFQDAEGQNMANAWALLEQDQLTPYTYAYEEAPVSNFIFAGWVALTDGFETFGFSINSGRVLMFVFHLMTVALIYATTRKMSDSDLAAVLAVLIFSLSPLALSLQRRVLVDNVMLVFLLGAFFFAVGDDRNLYDFMASALLFGIAVLIKSGSIIFVPAFLFTLSQTSHVYHRNFAINIWLVLAFILISTYPLYALMREELFPQGWLLGGDFPHVSLVERILDRGPAEGFIQNLGSGLGATFQEWTQLSNFTADPVLLYGGAISLIFLIVLSRDNSGLRPLVAVAMTYVFGLIIGGRVVVSDIISLLPFFAISTGIAITILINLVSGLGGKGILRPIFGLVALVVLLYPFWIFYGNRTQLYTLDQVSGQVEAVEWVKRNIPDDATLITDNFAFVALREELPNTHHYWKVDTDPDVKFTLLADNYCNIDYIITTPQVITDIDIFGLDLVRRAYTNAERLVEYENNGWPVEIWQVSKANCDSDEAPAIPPDLGTGEPGSGLPSTDADEEPATDDAQEDPLPAINT